MYKIKDNVDLKELEKYGYEECDAGHYRKKIPLDFLEKLFVHISRDKIFFRIESRFFASCTSIPYTQEEFGFFKTRKYLKPLIKNKLVEKVNK